MRPTTIRMPKAPHNALAELLDLIKVQAANFAKAKDDLRLQDMRRGGDGKLRDSVASLCEDRQTVMLCCNWSDDAATVSSSFMLPEPMAEEDFDGNFYVELIERDGEGYTE